MRHCFVFILCSFLISCSAPEEPVFKKLTNVTLNSFSLKKPYSVTLNADALFHNPNVLGANITELDFDVYINGKKTTHITQDVSATMPSKSDFILPIQCKIPLKEIFKDLKLKDILKAKVLEYKMDGHLKLGLGSVEVKVPFTYEGEEKASI